MIWLDLRRASGQSNDSCRDGLLLHPALSSIVQFARSLERGVSRPRCLSEMVRLADLPKFNDRLAKRRVGILARDMYLKVKHRFAIANLTMYLSTRYFLRQSMHNVKGQCRIINMRAYSMLPSRPRTSPSPLLVKR